MHYYQFNIGDYSSHTKGLSLLEDLAYRRMMDEYYLSQQPFNGCSTDVARCIGMRDHQQEVDYVLGRFFHLSDDKWTHKRIEKEISAYVNSQKAKSEAGKASAEARRIKALEQEHEQNPTGVEQALNSVQLTKNQEPRTKNQDITTTSKPSVPTCPVTEIIDLYKNHANRMPGLRVVPDKLRTQISARWRQDEKFQLLSFWKTLFEYCDSNEFLSGQSDGRGGKPFRADLLWITNPTNFAKIINGNYDR